MKKNLKRTFAFVALALTLMCAFPAASFGEPDLNEGIMLLCDAPLRPVIKH